MLSKLLCLAALLNWALVGDVLNNNADCFTTVSTLCVHLLKTSEQLYFLIV